MPRRRKLPENVLEFAQRAKQAIAQGKPERIIAVDPSINSSGMARFTDRKYVDSRAVTTKGTTVDERLESLFQQIKSELSREDPDLVVVERPDKWTRVNIPGKTGRALNAGDLMKLACAVGTIIGACHAVHLPVITVSVDTWKGQRSKAATHKRFQLVTGVTVENQHAADAAAMGLWVVEALMRMRG